jgi:hypothetical protein
VTQTQTVGVGDGSTLTWCSASKFCPSAGVSPAGSLVFNYASLTGGWFSGSVSGSTLTVTTRVGGAIEPGMTLGATGSPTILRCITNCSTPFSIDGSTWALSSSSANGASGTLASPLRADPTTAMTPFGGPTPWPNLNIQENGAGYALGGFGNPLVKAGTFKIADTDPATGIPTIVCQDSQVFAYNNTGSNCTGANVASSFVNYQTGDYQITFASGHAPLSGHAITASWTNIISTDSLSTSNRPQGLDFFGDSTGPQSGADAALFAKAPGGVNGHIYSGEGTDNGVIQNNQAPTNVGYQWGGIGYSQMVSWLYDTKFPNTISGASSGVSFLSTGQWRIEGPVGFIFPVTDLQESGFYDQWAQDVATSSLITGHITAAASASTGTLTLDAAATGPMWEGEIVDCVTVNTNCNVGPLSGVYITGLASGSWGANGSTYSIALSPVAAGVSTSASQPMQNPVFYSGPGPAFYVGTLNDVLVQNQGLAGTVGRNPHTSNGFTGGRRATSRWAAMIYGANGGNATDPKVDRVKADATGCDAAALAAPCFDVGTTYQATFSTATWTGNTVTISGGLAAHARPFVVGHAFSCSGCNPNLVITSLSVPPTESTATGAGEVGQSFSFTVQNAAGQAIGGSGSGAITAGCSGTSGTGSNCIDVAIALNVSGTFGTAAAIATCGANNLNGVAPNYVTPNGKCQDNGIGEIVRAFRIGTQQAMYGTIAGLPSGSVFDDGVDLGALGSFNQSAAFTCNIVAAKVVQCVKGPAYSGGVFSSIGEWLSGSTYISYGDVTIVSGRLGSLLGYVDGQSFPFTPGTGYTNGVYPGIAATCTTIQSPGTAPRFDITVAGGAIVDVVPSAATSGNVPAGLGVGSTCTVPLTTVTCSGGSCGGAIATIPVGPVEGVGGIGTFATDSNTMGMFLYDNSGFPGNPLNQFFTNGMGGYFEPGLPLRPFGSFQGAAVSDVVLSAPSNISLPVISGTPQVGQTLTASNGTWTNSPTGFADQWLAGGSPISGATSSTFVPVSGNVGQTISVTVTASNAIGSMPATSAGVGPVTSGGSSVPAFVAATCGSSFPSTGICADLISSSTSPHVVGGQVWDGTAQATVTPASLLTDTRSVAAPSDPGTSITTSVPANTLIMNSAGLQVFQNNINFLIATVGDYTGTAWAQSGAPFAAITRTKNTTGCTTAQQAPDGSCNTTEITIPAATGVSLQSALQNQVSGLTAGSPYTFSIWLKNSATTANPQAYINVQQGATPFDEIARTLVQPGSAWQRWTVTFTAPSTGSAFVEIGVCTNHVSVACNQGQVGGGTMEAWVSEVTPGTVPGPYVPTTTTAAATIALDNITATGDLATALASSGSVSVTTSGAGNTVAGTMLDSNGTVLLGKSANDNVMTALGATLTSKAQGNFPASETAFLKLGSGGSINLNGTPVATDATSRTPAAPFHVGTTSGTAAPLNGFITAIAVYPSAVSPPLVASAPITGVSIGTIATISSGTLQGAAPSTFVNGDSWNVTEDASGNVWGLCDDCGFGNFTGANGGNVILSESTFTPGSAGNPGFLNLGNASGGPPGLVDSFNSNLGNFSTGTSGSGTGNTWKSCGLIAVKDGTNTDLFAGLAFDFYAAAAPWAQTTSAATIASVVSTNAGTPASWNGLPPSPAVQAITTPTFSTEQFGSPCFVQYAPGYQNATLPTPNPDNSGSFLYATSNDGGWNGGSNIYLARIPLATIETSLGGSLAAASVPGNWQFYISTGCAGGDGTNSACWTSTLTSATPIFSLPNKLGRSSMTYLPATNRYEISTWFYPTTNGPTRTTQAQTQMSATSQFEFIDCAKPWSCTGVVSTIDYPTAGYYNPAVVPPSLATDGGFTATAIFTGNFDNSGNAPNNFAANAIYTPTMGQVTFRY